MSLSNFFYTTEEKVSCDGTENNVVGHPLVYLDLSKDGEAICPYCGAKSRSVHKIYIKTIADLPVQDKEVRIVLQRRVFFCKNPECDKSQFAERYSFVEDYGRRTKRLNERIIELAANMSALKAEGVVSNGLVGISDDTILRMLKKTAVKQ